MRQSWKTEFRNVLSAQKPEAVDVPMGVHVDKVGLKEFRNIRVALDALKFSDVVESLL